MNLPQLTKYLEQAWTWTQRDLLSQAALLQLAVLLALVLLAYGLGRLLSRVYEAHFRTVPDSQDALNRLIHAVGRVLWLAILVGLISLGRVAAETLGQDFRILSMASGLTLAFIGIRLAAGLLTAGPLRTLVVWAAWSLAALHIVDLLDGVLFFLDSLGTTFGTTYISLLMLIKGVVLFAILLKVVSILNSITHSRLARAQGLSPSLQALFTQLTKLTLYTVAFLMAVSAVGVDLTSLAVLFGALGVGIGFGLQAIFANLISGVILLLEQSVKPGDIIEVEGVSGEVTAVNIRYTVVRTRDGKEYIMPNENFIVNPVVVWTHGDPVVRLKVPVGIHYDSDPRLAMKLMIQAAKQTGRILKDPPPMAQLIGFGDNSVDLEIRVWINDAQQGVVNVQSDILLAIWDLFHEHNIGIPYPQRDIHIKELPGSFTGGEKDH
ncbi:MAG: mechanosensitive ion channel [Proteobacteria bacterium]|nr:mechanosensitive ion channel [Pseudomonadota bacterium]MBU1611335.1 mechanosensitive ion channel [Pseudomonadota bacterium]